MIEGLFEFDVAMFDLEECFRTTITSIEDIVSNCDGQWESANILLRRLAALEKALSGAVPQEVKAAMSEAYEEHERLSDLADAQSY